MKCMNDTYCTNVVEHYMDSCDLSTCFDALTVLPHNFADNQSRNYFVVEEAEEVVAAKYT